MFRYLLFNSNTFEKKAFWVLVFLLCTAALVYGYLIQETIIAIASRADIRADIRDINTSIGELESEYNTLIDTFSYSSARELGFIPAEDRVFAIGTRLVKHTQ